MEIAEYGPTHGHAGETTMDGHTLEKIRGLLLARWTRDEAQLKPVSETIDEEEPATSAEIIDIAQALEQLGRDTTLKEAGRRELLAVEKALAKMATGSFGICEDCGEEIPAKRLLVLPAANLCAHCQAYEERQASRTRVNRAIA
jgi:DnaK suppressor protein